MFDEYSLADSQTLGTGYVVNKHDGSISMITDEFNDQDSKTTISEKGGSLPPDVSSWNVFNSLFRVRRIQFGFGLHNHYLLHAFGLHNHVFSII